MNQPLVTLGMPVYNEALYILETLQNIQKQSYPNLEIIIADNGSMDGTSEICQQHADQDGRIKYIRHPNNIGQNANFNYLPRSASGTYFCWVSGHDLLDPTFVEDCVRALELHPEAVLAYPRTINMTKEGKRTREKVRQFDIRHMRPHARFNEVMWRVDCNYVYGMWRLVPMLDTELFQAIPAADRVFLAAMAIKGTFEPVNTFKYYRMSRESIQTEIEKRHRIMKYIFPHRTTSDRDVEGRKFYRHTFRAFYRVIQDADFPWYVRWYMYKSIWLCSIAKAHLLPGTETLSVIVKKILPRPLLQKLLSQMQ